MTTTSGNDWGDDPFAVNSDDDQEEQKVDGCDEGLSREDVFHTVYDSDEWVSAVEVRKSLKMHDCDFCSLLDRGGMLTDREGERRKYNDFYFEVSDLPSLKIFKESYVKYCDENRIDSVLVSSESVLCSNAEAEFIWLHEECEKYKARINELEAKIDTLGDDSRGGKSIPMDRLGAIVRGVVLLTRDYDVAGGQIKKEGLTEKEVSWALAGKLSQSKGGSKKEPEAIEKELAKIGLVRDLRRAIKAVLPQAGILVMPRRGSRSSS